MTDNERIKIITKEIINLNNSQVTKLCDLLENESQRNTFIFDNPPNTNSISNILVHFGLLLMIKQQAVIYFAKYEIYRRM
jgi:hypothetical protein